MAVGAPRGQAASGGGMTSGAASRWTVVIPCYNEEAFIGATLASLAAQTERFALVVVD
ncbi:MAG: glycosyltransferase, partial [Polymorphobacter sp.]